MKTALAHHWLTGMRGGERVLEAIVPHFPNSPLYTLVARPQTLSPLLASQKIHQSWLGKIPTSELFYRHALPLHPLAIHSLKILHNTQLLISSDASLIKGIPVPEGCTHLCYCHSPPRYLWEMPETYLQSSSHHGWLTRIGFNLFQKHLQQFDFNSAQKVDHFIANSAFTRQRIQRFYGRDATVIPPPVDTDFFQPSTNTTRDHSFLIVSSLVPYKRVDLAVAACRQLELPLTIIGDGPERPFLEKLAGPKTQFLGRQSDEIIRSHYQKSRALLFPGLEDFGIVPVEAQACGCPVIAFAAGGALESVVSGQSGFFFPEQTTSALVAALQELIESNLPTPTDSCRSSALRFSKALFREKFLSFVSAYSYP
jgi:glycosyltransferase involved in cell wall biosynthesis